jgi:4-hydroxybenzoate polyprenyltransferase
MRAPPFIKTAKPYWELMRFHRPIGTLLLLWPTWWALWLAAGGFPKISLLIIFSLGVVVMRAAGCVINDIADRSIDKHVTRTHNRPLTSGALNLTQAKITFIALLVLAFGLVLLTNLLTIGLAFIALILASVYPFMKRYTHLPQVVLGAAFSMSIPMAFAATNNAFDSLIVVIYCTNLLWTVVYDTFYGMVDREFDKKIGVKSTAILFEGNELIIIGSLQVLTLFGFILIGQRFDLANIYYLAIMAAAALMIYQQVLINRGQTPDYFKAFLNNNWLGFVIFAGIALSYMMR